MKRGSLQKKVNSRCCNNDEVFIPLFGSLGKVRGQRERDVTDETK